MQDEVMLCDPATGKARPYPSHADQWRRHHGLDCAWLFNPWTGERRNALDVGSDVTGRLIVPTRVTPTVAEMRGILRGA